MLDLELWKQKLTKVSRDKAATIINNQCFQDYPERNGKHLARIARSCAAVEVGSCGHDIYFSTRDNAPAVWNEKQLITVGFSDEKPKLDKARKYLKLNNTQGKPFYITWEDV